MGASMMACGRDNAQRMRAVADVKCAIINIIVLRSEEVTPAQKVRQCPLVYSARQSCPAQEG